VNRGKKKKKILEKLSLFPSVKKSSDNRGPGELNSMRACVGSKHKLGENLFAQSIFHADYLEKVKLMVDTKNNVFTRSTRRGFQVTECYC
jgi:hypothetical protein